MADGGADRRLGARRAAGRGPRAAARGEAPPDAASVATVEIEVPFHDCDPLGIVWHGHYYKYFELARTALLRSRSLDGRDLGALGFGFLLIESRCRHLTPLRYGEHASVAAWLRDVAHRVAIAYEIRRAADGAVAARGETVLATVDRAGRLLVRTPRAIRERLEASPAA